MTKRLYIFIISILSLTACNDYIVENDGVYYKDWNESRGFKKRLLKELDPETFETLDNDDYGKDSKLVYYKGNPIIGADALTFEFIGDLYATDKNRAYYAGKTIQNSSNKEFKIIDSYYSSDYKDIYYTTEPLHVSSVKNFKIFPNSNNDSEYQRWSTDGYHYFFMNFKIPSNDYKNIYLFKESAGFAKDRKWVYMMSRKLNFDDEGKKIIDTIDVATFRVNNYIDCEDKFGCINPYLGRQECNK
ncbi:MAG: DKNYY domain-containing protein [Flavobacteriales bacterium]